MSYYEARQEGHPEAYQTWTVRGEDAGDRKASREDALNAATRTAEEKARERQRCWEVAYVNEGTRPPERHMLTRFGYEHSDQEAGS